MRCLKIQSPMGLFQYNYYWHLAFFFFFGGDASLAKGTMTELYKNLSFETLCRNQNTEFEKVSDLNAHINFTMKHSILSNIDKKNHLMVKTIYCLT